MPLLPFLIALAQEDARLTVRASLLQPHATYAELGAWVQRTTGVPVYVVPAIRERKATVLVEDRPVRETMDRVAEALFLEWERTQDGYTLRAEPKAAAEESRYAAAEAKAWQAGLREAMATLADAGRYRPEALKEQLSLAQEESGRAAREPGEEGKARAEAANDRWTKLQRVVYGGLNHSGGVVLASLTPARREAIFQGQPVLTSNRPGPGLLPVPAGLPAAAARDGWRAEGRMIYEVSYLPETGELFLSLGRPDASGYSRSSIPLKGDEWPAYRKALADQPLNRRLRDFVAVQDAALMATPVKPEPPQPETVRQTPFRSLADVLIPLHRRTGLPIVADGNRVALVAKHPPEGATVAAWYADLDPFRPRGGFRGPKPNLRADKGWLMFRQFRYWKQRVREVPEKAVRSLEIAAHRPGGATLDAYAAFVGSLTPAQRPYLDGASLVMDAPNLALEGNVTFLRLWNALSAGARRSALTEAGLGIAGLPTTSRELALACVAEKMTPTSVSEAMLPWTLPGAPPLPASLRLTVALKPVGAYDYNDGLLGEIYVNSPGGNQVAGATATLDVPEGSSFGFYSLPLQPAPPSKPFR